MDVDISGITFVEWMTFTTYIRGAATRQAINLIDKYITAWGYDLPIEGGLRSLPNVLEVNKCLRIVMDNVQDRVSSYDVRDVKVDLSKWTFDDYDRWEDARVNNNWALTESMLHQVAELAGSSPDKPLNCIAGLRMTAAIVEVYKKSFLEPS